MKRVAALSQQVAAAAPAVDIGGGALWKEATVRAAAGSIGELLTRYEVQPALNIEYTGMNHVALVCSDMAKTVRFFGDVLGLRLSKTIDIGNGGQHFFFDVGKGAQLAYFWFPEAPKPIDGASRYGPAKKGGEGMAQTSLGSMHHIAFNVDSEEELMRCKVRLEEHGVQQIRHMIHADTPSGLTESWTDPLAVWNSVYFAGPDGEALEFSTTRREIGGARDIQHMPNTQAKILELPAEPTESIGMGANWKEQLAQPPAASVAELVERYGAPKPDGVKLTGLNHVALVSSDMSRTVKFFGEVLGLRVSKTLDLPGDHGQHFFFDMGNGAHLAYFWFPEVVRAVDGVSRPSLAAFMAPPEKQIFPKTAVGSMNHFAFAVKDLAMLETARKRLKEMGLFVTPVMCHADGVAGGVTRDPTDPKITFRSIYFFGPDGEQLEISVTEREMGGARDIEHMPGGMAKLV